MALNLFASDDAVRSPQLTSAPILAIAATVGLLLWSTASSTTSPAPHIALWAAPVTTLPQAQASAVLQSRPLVAEKPRIWQSTEDLPVPHRSSFQALLSAGTRGDVSVEVPAGPRLVLGLGSLAAAVYSMWALGKWWSSRETECTPLAMLVVTGEKFNPLGLEEPQVTKLSPDAEMIHGRLVLGGLLVTGCLVASLMSIAPPALAEGLDFGFNYDFDVEFQGIKIDHRILVDVIVTGQAIGFVGALIGGYSARQRKKEVEELAMKLKQVNRQLRQQARRQKEGLYAPLELKVATVPYESATEVDTSNVIELLKKGKKLLRDGDAQLALTAFQQSLAAIDSTSDFKDPLMAKRKAYRGLGSAYVQLGRLQLALDAMMTVLSLTKQIGDNTGLCDAYGVIADIYTDMNKLDKAAEFYDLYISNLEQDQSSDAV